jgi:hypothetical protein
MSEKKEKKGMSTEKKNVDDFISGAAADRNSSKPTPKKTPQRTAPASSEGRGRPASDEPMKIKNFYLPIALIQLIQDMADQDSNADPGKGNTSQFARKFFEAEAKKRKLL